MHLKVFLKLEKPQKLSLLGKYIKKTKKPQKNTGLGLKKNLVFSNPVSRPANWKTWRTTAGWRSRACRSSSMRHAWPSLTTSTRTGSSGTTCPVSSGGCRPTWLKSKVWICNGIQIQARSKRKLKQIMQMASCAIINNVPTWPYFFRLTKKIPVQTKIYRIFYDRNSEKASVRKCLWPAQKCFFLHILILIYIWMSGSKFKF